VEGELLQANITCDGIAGMLLFKFNGSRILSDKGTVYNTYTTGTSTLPETCTQIEGCRPKGTCIYSGTAQVLGGISNMYHYTCAG